MSKRSMAKTAPEKMKPIDQKNPENKDPQSVQRPKHRSEQSDGLNMPNNQ